MTSVVMWSIGFVPSSSFLTQTFKKGIGIASKTQRFAGYRILFNRQKAIFSRMEEVKKEGTSEEPESQPIRDWDALIQERAESAEKAKSSEESIATADDSFCVDDLDGSGFGNANGGNGDNLNLTHERREEDDGGPFNVDETLILVGTRRALKKIVRSASSALSNGKVVFGELLHEILKRVRIILDVVPPQVIVAIISVFSTLGGQRIKARQDRSREKLRREEAVEREKARIEAELRENYQQLANSLLKSTIKLAERLIVIIKYASFCEKEYGPEKGTGCSPEYSAYLLGRYLATIELFKQRSSMLDLGFPAADRIFLNILGRIQGVLAADDNTLHRMQCTELFFHPSEGHEPLKSGPLRVLPRAQLSLGQLLLRKKVQQEDDKAEQAQSGSKEIVDTTKPDQVMSYIEFVTALDEDRKMRHWFMPVIEGFKRLEDASRADDLADARSQRAGKTRQKHKAVGARAFFLQSALMDLVGFLDPGPQCRFVPMYKRRKLSPSGRAQIGEPLMPTSLRQLYDQLAMLRDSRVHNENIRGKVKFPAQVEVFVKSPERDKVVPGILSEEYGDCPFSQRVLLVLEEMGIPYRPVYISSRAKPTWFHLLHPENMTPVIYHEGKLIGESRQIVSYLLQKFAGHKALATTSHLGIPVGSATFTSFHDSFIDWIGGRIGAREELERSLRRLDNTLIGARIKNNGLPFLGGASFSREDTAIAPMLHHVDVAGREIMNWEIPEDCTHVKAYLKAALETPSFKKTAASSKSIVAGYNRVKCFGPEKAVWLADTLE